MSSQAIDLLVSVLRKLRTHEGLTEPRLRATQVEFDVLLRAPSVRDWSHATEQTEQRSLVEAVRSITSDMAPTSRLILDTALCLQSVVPKGDDLFGELYAADLMQRRTALLNNWQTLHRILGDENPPAAPSGTRLRVSDEDEAFRALAKRLLRPARPSRRAASDDELGRAAVGRAVVFGSAVLDTLLQIPVPLDPTVRSSFPTDTHDPQPGGKGLTQAVALARLGFEVDLVAAIGNDDAGDEIMAFCADEGIGTEHLIRLPGSTPRVYVVTDSKGKSYSIAWENEREIALRPELVARRFQELDPDDLAFFTFEIPFEAMRDALGTAPAERSRRPTVFVIPAPPHQSTVLETEVFSRIDYLVARRWELRELVGIQAQSDDGWEEDGRAYLKRMGVGEVVVVSDKVTEPANAGRGGGLVMHRIRESAGAREALCAGLAYGLRVGEPPDGPGSNVSGRALDWAEAAMELATMQPGVSRGMPTVGAVERLLASEAESLAPESQTAASR